MESKFGPGECSEKAPVDSVDVFLMSAPLEEQKMGAQENVHSGQWRPEGAPRWPLS